MEKDGQGGPSLPRDTLVTMGNSHVRRTSLRRGRRASLRHVRRTSLWQKKASEGAGLLSCTVSSQTPSQQPTSNTLPPQVPVAPSTHAPLRSASARREPRVLPVTARSRGSSQALAFRLSTRVKL